MRAPSDSRRLRCVEGAGHVGLYRDGGSARRVEFAAARHLRLHGGSRSKSKFQVRMVVCVRCDVRWRRFGGAGERRPSWWLSTAPAIAQRPEDSDLDVLFAGLLHMQAQRHARCELTEGPCFSVSTPPASTDCDNNNKKKNRQQAETTLTRSGRPKPGFWKKEKDCDRQRHVFSKVLSS